MQTWTEKFVSCINPVYPDIADHLRRQNDAVSLTFDEAVDLFNLFAIQNRRDFIVTLEGPDQWLVTDATSGTCAQGLVLGLVQDEPDLATMFFFNETLQ